jgi:hypothetical protein
MMKPPRGDPSAGSGLLHNMSVQPRTAIIHSVGDRFLRGSRLVFALPPGSPALTPLSLLEALDGMAPASEQQAEAELRRRLNAHALTLPLPAAAAVLDQTGENASCCQDLLTVLTVLAKSSSRVYLRDKEPNLAAINRRRVVLLLPPDWKLPS